MNLLSQKSTLIISGLVLATALTTLIPQSQPELPGIVRLVLLEGPGENITQRASMPFCEYLGSQLRRAVRPHAAPAAAFQSGDVRFDLALVPNSLIEDMPDVEILAWAKGAGAADMYRRPYVLFPRGQAWHELESPRLILGDRWTWCGNRGGMAYLQRHGHAFPAGFAEVAFGHNPYDHSEAIFALVHGAYDVAIVREGDLRRAIDEGVLDGARFSFAPAGEPKDDFALVAQRDLSGRARGRVRTAALNLKAYRFDETNYQVASVRSSLALLGLEGFEPTEPLPNLRP